MGLTKDEIAEKSDKEKILKLLQEMQQAVKYNVVPLSQPSLLNASIKRIPWLSKFLRKVDDTANTLLDISEKVHDLHDVGGHESVSQGFHFGAIAMAAADFFRIPFIYLAAYLLGEEVPINLNNNARWVYSALLFSLTIAAIAVPAAAPVIAFVIAGVGLTAGLFLLGKTLYERYELGHERKQIKRAIEKEEGEMHLIQQQAMDLERKLTITTNEEDIIAIYNEIAVLQDHYNSQKKALEVLKNKELHVEQRMQKVGTIKVLDRTFGVGLAALTVIGLVVSLFFPPAGAAILAGVAIAGGVYLAARITAPLFKALGNWLIGQFKTSPGFSVTNKEQVNENSLTDTKEKQKDSSLGIEANLSKDLEPDKAVVLAEYKTIVEKIPHESTTDVLVGLLGKEKAIEALKLVVSPNNDENNKLNQESSSLDEFVTLFPVVKNLKDKEEGEGKSERESERPGSH